MKSILLALLVILPVQAFASDRAFYLDVSIGGSMPEGSKFSDNVSNADKKTDYSAGYSFSAALGYQPVTERGLLYHTRFEIEGAARKNDIEKVDLKEVTNGSLQSISVMANVLYDVHNSSQLTPYVGGGLGVAEVTIDESVELQVDNEQSDVVPVFQFMTGVTYEPSKGSSNAIHLGYKYFGSMDDVEYTTSTGSTTSSDLRNHIIEGGLRVDF